MEFEFDEQKSIANKNKHGIDFVEAQQIWNDLDHIEIPARTEDEPRYLVIGKIDDRCWSAVITFGQEKIRIISVSDPGKRSLKFMKAKTFDKRFEKGEDISQQLDLSKTVQPGQEQKRVNVDLPVWMVQSLDKEAKRLGVTRQSIIKVWLAERLQHASTE